jgi:hypothetical protein
VGAQRRTVAEKHPGITGRLVVDGGLAGGIVAAAFLVMGWLGLPQARGFPIGTAVLGGLLGLILWSLRR